MAAPFVFTENPDDLVQITMEGSVGDGGANKADDVRLIQTLLNAVPSPSGQPVTKLAVDGRVGPKTIDAIRQFQRKYAGNADGRIDPGRKTIRTLVPLLRSNNALPVGVPGLGPPDPRVKEAFSTPVGAGVGRFGFSLTPWRFAGSGSLSLAVDMYGASVGTFVIVSDADISRLVRLKFGGFGVGVSALPIGFDVAFEGMKSWGSRIMKGFFVSAPFENPGDFVGPCKLVVGGGNIGPGLSGTLVGFMPGMMSSAFGGVAGMQIGMPGFEVTLYLGYIASFS